MGLISRYWQMARIAWLRRRLGSRLDRQPVAVAQILLLFRMLLAEGIVRDNEMAAFEAICREHFGIAPDEMPALHSYLERRQRLSDAEARERLFTSMTMAERMALIGMMGRIAGARAAPAMDDSGRIDSRFIRETAAALGVSDTAAKVAYEGGNDARAV